MFKPHYGRCVCCGKEGLIVVKAGYRQQCNEAIKRGKKLLKPKRFPLLAMPKETKEQRLKIKNKLQEQIDEIMGKEKKIKLKSISRLKKQADKLFSEVVRRIYADGRGRVKCITCPTKRHWKQMQAGHYITRAAVRVRYDFRNVHPQCGGCNLFKKGAPDIYALEILKKYGAGILEELNKLKTDSSEWKRAEYNEIILMCTDKLVELNIKNKCTLNL